MSVSDTGVGPPPGGRAPHLRCILHHQGAGLGDGARHQPVDRRVTWRAPVGGSQRGPRRDLPLHPAGGRNARLRAFGGAVRDVVSGNPTGRRRPNTCTPLVGSDTACGGVHHQLSEVGRVVSSQGPELSCPAVVGGGARVAVPSPRTATEIEQRAPPEASIPSRGSRTHPAAAQLRIGGVDGLGQAVPLLPCCARRSWCWVTRRSPRMWSRMPG